MSRRWQPHFDDCAAGFRIPGGNFSAVFFNDAVTNAETESSSLAHALGGVERLKNAAGFGEARPRVMKFDDHVLTARMHPNSQAALLTFQHRIQCVIDDVAKDLFQLVGISGDSRHIRLDLTLQLDAAHFHVIVAEKQCFIEHLYHIEVLFFRLPLPGEREEVLDHAMRTLRLLENFAHIFHGASFQLFRFEQLRVTQNRC